MWLVWREIATTEDTEDTEENNLTQWRQRGPSGGFPGKKLQRAAVSVPESVKFMLMSRDDSSAELGEKIKKDIENSGFPLEFHVLNVCSTRNTGRMPGLRYEFQGQPRELDLLAFFENIELNPKRNPNLQHTSTDLIIECKKRADKPWVFLSSPSYAFSNMTQHLKYTSDYDLYFTNKRVHRLLPQIFPKLRRNYYADPAVPKCISYYEALKDPKQPSDIYKSINNVISYTLYRRNWRTERQEEFGTFSEFYLPIIVLDGRLFEASITPDTIEVNERAHIQLRTFHLQGLYVVDVVTRDYFPALFGRIEALHKQIVSAIGELRLPADFRAMAWSRLKQTMESDEEGLIAMMKADGWTRNRRGRRPKSPPAQP